MKNAASAVRAAAQRLADGRRPSAEQQEVCDQIRHTAICRPTTADGEPIPYLMSGYTPNSTNIRDHEAARHHQTPREQRRCKINMNPKPHLTVHRAGIGVLPALIHNAQHTPPEKLKQERAAQPSRQNPRMRRTRVRFAWHPPVRHSSCCSGGNLMQSMVVQQSAAYSIEFMGR